MKSKNQKIKQRFLDSLKERTKLNYNPGPLLRQKFRKFNRKDRRHSGRKTIFIDGKYPYMETFYEEWENYRDGFRDCTKLDKPNLFWNSKHREVCRERNKKIKKQLAIRKARKLRRNSVFTP